MKDGKPTINRQLFASCLYEVHTFLPPKKGQPLNNGQNACPQCVHYSEMDGRSYDEKCVELIYQSFHWRGSSTLIQVSRLWYQDIHYRCIILHYTGEAVCYSEKGRLYD